MMRPARKANRTAQAPTAQPVAFPAPTGGWVENLNIATGGPGTARVMENIFPGVQGCRVRGGRKKVATVGARVKSMFTYQSGVVNRMFAATSAAIYDITGLIPSTVPTAAVSGMTSGYWSTVQMGTAGGEFLVAVNGTDTPRTFDGTTWATTAITGVTSSELSYVSKHKSRLWFVQKNSLKAWYLPVDSIAGAAADLSLAGIMQRGGSLMFIATWSQDAGDGQDDRIVFVSTEGEVAVYQGSNPASAADWSLVGLYNITKPLGPKCHFPAGGDLVIGTETGLIPLSAVTQKDPAAMDVSALSVAIEQSWRDQVKRRTVDQPMELFKWPRENMLMVSLPHDQTTSFVANIQTGAWCKYIGWDVQAATVFRDQMYIGDRAGFVYAAEVGGSDEGAATGGAFVPTVDNGNLATAVLNASSLATVDVGGGPTNESGWFDIKPDGTTAYFCLGQNPVVYQFTLSTPGNIATATYSGKSFSVSDQISISRGTPFVFSPDGLNFFMTRNGVYKYTLTTSWDISTASYTGQFFSTASQDSSANGLAFRPDGMRMLVLGFSSKQVYQYSLSTPWNLATASYDGIALTGLGASDGQPIDICFGADGSALYISDYNRRRVAQYSLPSPWTLSGASFLRALSVDTEPGPGLPYGIRINPAGTRFYVKGENRPWYQYDLGTTSTPIAITGSPYICKLSYMPSDLGGTATEKTVGMIRARFLSSSPIAPQLSVATNYSVDFPPAPAATAIPAGGGSLWGVARWGVSRWGSGDISAVRGTYDTGWISVGANGQVVAPQWQIVIDGDGRPSAELLVIDVLIEPGGI
jgi:hypothetical protein